MTSDPYRAPEISPDVPARDLPATDPLRADRIEPAGGMTALWVPILIALAFVVGLSYYYRHSDTVPNARADAGPVTHPAPSPN
jgi:hypothetical protein